MVTTRPSPAGQSPRCGGRGRPRDPPRRARAAGHLARRPYGDDGPTTLGDTIASHDDGFHRAEQRAALARLTAILPPRERRIVALRFQHDLTHQQIGELVGLSQMQISRILRQAITKHRDYAAAERSRGEAA